MDKQTDNIQVMVRVRPLNEREKNEGAKSCVILDEDKPNNITIDAKPEPKTFKFDFVGGDKTTQEDIFQIAAKPLMMSALEGYNACIFAYGQTGAGKTFTMQGRGLEEDRDSKERGVQPRVFDHLFSLTNKMGEELAIDYLIKCSYLEIYNEQIIDLLSNTQSNLMVREDIGKGVYIEGLTEEIVRGSDETIQLLLRGMRNRHVGSTNMNFESSRSHSVFSMTIESKNFKDGMTNLKVSKLHFVDLAGSERQKQTAAAGERLKEASNINKSLTTLGLVINSLVQAQGKSRHIAYRDSKLTFLLKDSLGGNSRTYMIAAVSAASTSFQETLSTLQFAQRAKMIKNKAQINEEAQGNVESLKKEIKRLKEDLLYQKSLMDNLEDQIKSGKLNNTSSDMEIEEKLFEDSIEEDDLFGNLKEKDKDKNNSNSDSISSLLSAQEFQYLLDSTRISLETEEQLQKQIQSIKHEITFTIMPQLIKKDEYINGYQQGVSTQESCENYYKNILNFSQQRIKNLNKLIQNKVDQDMLKAVMHTNQELMNEQYEELLKLMGETPNIMNVYEENVLLRSKLESLEQEEQCLSTQNLIQNTQGLSAQELAKNIQQLIPLTEVLYKTIEDRRAIREKLEKIASQKMDTSERVSNLEDQIRRLKMEHNDVLQSLNSQLASGEQRELALNRGLEQERSKVLELKHTIISLKESKAKDIQAHQVEIEELLTQFNQIDDQKNQATDQYQLSIEQLNYRVLELETKLTASKQLANDTQEQLQNRDGIIVNHNAELEKLQRQLNSSVNQAAQQKCELDSLLNTFKSKNTLLQQELAMQIDNVNALKSRINAFEINEENHKQQFDGIMKEKNEEIKRIELELNEKIDQFIRLQQHMETKEDKIASQEADRIKLQEEIGILNDTNSYKQQEIEDRNTLLQQIQDKVKNSDKEIEELKQKIETLSLEAQQVQQTQIQQQPQLQQQQQSLNNENNNKNGVNQNILSNSSFVNGPLITSLAPSVIYNMEGTKKLSGIEAISNQNHQLRIQVEFESNQNISLRSQMLTLQNRATEVVQSEKHFRVAFLEVRNQLQVLQEKHKEMMQNLQSKEIDYLEVTKLLKLANENIHNLQKKFDLQKAKIKKQEQIEIESENKIKKLKDANFKLQETVRSKMDGLQQAFVRNGELETKIAIMSKETAVLKNEIKGKCLSEKKVQDLIGSFANQRIEIAQKDKIISSKFEENIALTTNNRQLQSLIEKYTQTEWELKQQIKICNETEAGLKRRIDELIEDYSNLEQLKLQQELKSKEAKDMLTQTMIAQNTKNFVPREEVKQIILESQQVQRQEFAKKEQFLFREKQQLLEEIRYLEQQLKDKEDELKGVHQKIGLIQDGIQQAQQYFKKYQELADDNKKMHEERDIQEDKIKTMEQQLRNIKYQNQNSSEGNNSINFNNNNIIPQEKYLELNEKYQNLKRKYIDLYEDSRRNKNNDKKVTSQQQSQTLQLQDQQQEQENENVELNQFQDDNVCLKEENQRLLEQVGNNTSKTEHDISPEISTRVAQLCEFVFTQLTQTNKDLLVNIPSLSESVEQNIIFMLHAFNNLFEHIKSKDSTLASILANEVKSRKKIAFLEKDNIHLKRQLSVFMQQQPSTASSSAVYTPKRSVNSGYKIPRHQGIITQSGSDSVSNSSQKHPLSAILSKESIIYDPLNNYNQNNQSLNASYSNSLNSPFSNKQSTNKSSNEKSNLEQLSHETYFQQQNQTELTNSRISSDNMDRSIGQDEFIKKKIKI